VNFPVVTEVRFARGAAGDVSANRALGAQKKSARRQNGLADVVSKRVV
jgi:hypothetical protein